MFLNIKYYPLRAKKRIKPCISFDLAHQYILKRQNNEIIEKEHVNKVPTEFF
jgi:hypothetical protein